MSQRKPAKWIYWYRKKKTICQFVFGRLLQCKISKDVWRKDADSNVYRSLPWKCQALLSDEMIFDFTTSMRLEIGFEEDCQGSSTWATWATRLKERRTKWLITSYEELVINNSSHSSPSHPYLPHSHPIKQEANWSKPNHNHLTNGVTKWRYLALWHTVSGVPPTTCFSSGAPLL